MPTTAQISSILYYKSLGKGFTDQGKPFFEEDPSIDAFLHLLPDQLWAQADRIPEASPWGTPNDTTMSTYDGNISGIVQYHHNLQLLHKSTMGAKTFFHPDLKDSIPFNFGDGTYNYYLRTQSGDQVAFGQGDWIVDNDQGKITFYGSLPSGVSSSTPPQISFYRYVGTKGFENLSVENLDVSTLKISNLNGVLEAVDGSIQVSSIQSLKSREMDIFGSGTASSYNLNHGLNTIHHDVTMYDSSTNELTYADVTRGANTDTITFNNNVPNGQNYNIIFMGF